MENTNQCCASKVKMRGPEEYKSLINRLNRIEGQVRGVRGMIENNAYCTDILIQVSAITSALCAFNKELLERHIKECVTNDIKNDKLDSVDELLYIIGRMMR